MTIEERLKMYREKRQFVYEISMTFIKVPKGHSVKDVTYEVFFKESDWGWTDLTEWVTVTYDGGGKAHKCVSGNSNAANFVVIGSMLQGGCYEQVRIYEEQSEQGYEKVKL